MLMKKIYSSLNRLATVAAMTALLCTLAAPAQADETQTTIPSATGIQKKWTSHRTVFDYNTAKSYFYQFTDDGGYVMDADGNYVTITLQEYCEKFAEDWNADEANEQKITAEEAADRTLDSNHWVAFEADGETMTMTYGYGEMMTVTYISGPYTYDETTGVATIEDTVESSTKTCTFSVDPETGSLVVKNATEWYPFDIMTYDQTVSYLVFCPTYYYCEKYDQTATGISQTASETQQAKPVAHYNASGMQLSQPVRGLNIVRMSDGSVRKVMLK